MLSSCSDFILLSFSVLPFISLTIRLPPCSLILQQMMQQQAALMAATQGSYLNPMAAIAAAQMQQMAAFNVNGLVATPMTPSSGMRQHFALTGKSHSQSGECCCLLQLLRNICYKEHLLKLKIYNSSTISRCCCCCFL